MNQRATRVRRGGFRLGVSLLVASASFACAPGTSGSSCGNDFDCGGGLFCASGVCRQSGRTCAAASDCDATQVCSAGVCVSDCEATGCPAGETCSPTLNECVTLMTLSTGGSGGTGTTGGTTGSQCTTDTWTSFAGHFFQSYCNQCHGWTQQTVRDDSNISLEIKNGYMPPIAPRPDSKDVTRILTWIQCGEP